jgi:Uma2 family endonuclease
VCTR